MTITAKLKETILLYHQDRIASDKAGYFATEEHFRLRRERAEAEQNNRSWLEILAKIRQSLPDYAVRDFTNLADNSCYEGEILLHQNMSFLDDDVELLTLLKGRRLTLRLLVSVLGPFYFFLIEEQRYNPADDKHSFKIIEAETPEHQRILQEVKQIVERYCYSFLKRSTLKEVVPKLTTEFQGQGSVTVFHCLFSDLMNFY
ncbi:hypothetical protein QUF58_01440 [Anaerolineales bacterium HSG24]|nr:hypothetical protein [Anaerolineales bacterium HSG24]